MKEGKRARAEELVRWFLVAEGCDQDQQIADGVVLGRGEEEPVPLLNSDGATEVIEEEEVSA